MASKPFGIRILWLLAIGFAGLALCGGSARRPSALPAGSVYVARVTWSPEPSTSHERLVFLAAHDGMAARSRRWWHSLIRIAGTQSGLPSAAGAAPRLRPDKELRSRSMQLGVVIADRLADRFTIDERRLLRDAGELPEWFWPAYDDGVRHERARR